MKEGEYIGKKELCKHGEYDEISRTDRIVLAQCRWCWEKFKINKDVFDYEQDEK